MITQDRKCLGAISFLAGIPAVPTPFAISWGQQIACCYEQLCGPGQYIDLAPPPRHSVHSQARNDLARSFEGDWLIQFDADHRFDPDTAARLVATADTFDLDVVTGLYYQKEPPYLPCLYHWDETEGAFQQLSAWADIPDLRFFQVEGAGGGCLFVRRSVFDRIREELGEEPFAHMEGFSAEDLPFFRRLMKLGIPAFCAPAIHARHLRWADSEPSGPRGGGSWVEKQGVKLA